MIKIVKDEWTPFIKELDKIPVTLIQISAKTVRDIIRLWVTRAQSITKQLGLIKTGYYFDSHKLSSYRVDSDRKTYVKGYFGSDAHYAGYLEDGTRAHGPVHAKYLVWRGNKGELIFAKWVRGIKPYRVWGRAIDNTDSDVRAIIDRNIEKELKTIPTRIKRGRVGTY